MFSENQDAPPPTPLVFWVIWFAILNGLFIIAYFAAPRPEPDLVKVDEAQLLFVMISVLVGVISLGIRFLVIPKLRSLQTMMMAMMIGLAIAEMSGIVGMFVVSTEHHSTRVFMFVVAVICIAIHAPVYVKRLQGDGLSLQVDP